MADHTSNLNPKHPKKNSTISVEPIRKIKDIKLIKKMLVDKPRDLCIFTMGINTNLRGSDLLSITVDQVYEAKDKDYITLKEKKTGKARRITLNKAAITAIQDHEEARRMAIFVPFVRFVVKNFVHEAITKIK